MKNQLTISPLATRERLSIKVTTIQSQSRKLKATWHAEVAKDLKAYHSLDAEKELKEMYRNRAIEDI